MKTIMFIIFFLFLGAFFIISEQNIKLNSIKNIEIFFDYYLSWIYGLIDNGKTVSGYVVKMEWLPK